MREFAKVFTRMPKAATRKLPEMPTRLKSTMIATRKASKPCRKPK